jgi:hypothetical protein
MVLGVTDVWLWCSGDVRHYVRTEIPLLLLPSGEVALVLGCYRHSVCPVTGRADHAEAMRDSTTAPAPTRQRG